MRRSDLTRILGPARTRRWRAPTGQTPDIAILGTGFAGIGMAIRLKQAGIDSFTIYEKADRVGGTWRDNTYPGAACDVPSHLYSFSFEPAPSWSRHFAPQAEILAYLERCTDRYALHEHIRFGSEVTSARYDDDTCRWELGIAGGPSVSAAVLVSGLGQLNRPAYPDLPGIDDFAGTQFHSARWNHDHDLTGERIAVIGNGASAVQFVPKIAPGAAHLYQVQRSANWIGPKPDRLYADVTKDLFRAVPALERAYRAGIYLSFESRFLAFRDRDGAASKLFEKGIRAYLRQQVPDPELRAVLTPDYPVGCKRVLISNDYYATLQRDNVEVVTDPIERVTPDGLRTASGRDLPVDTIIYGTGFDSTHFLSPLEIVGHNGVRLDEVWRDGAEAYLGMTVAGFPNLFMLYGPNTNLGHNSILFMIERQLTYVLQCLRSLVDHDLAAIDVRHEVMDRYNDSIQESVRSTVWNAGCHSWYKTDSGKVTNNWPRFTLQYWWDTVSADLDDFDQEPARTHPRRRVAATGSG